MTSRPSTAAPILAVLAVVVTLLGTYVGGYYGLGAVIELREFPRDSPPVVYGVERHYPYSWQQNIFWPATKVESGLRKCQVWAHWTPYEDRWD